MRKKKSSYQEVPQDANERRTEKTDHKHRQSDSRNNHADDFDTSHTVDSTEIPVFEINPKVHKIKLSSIPALFLEDISHVLTEQDFKRKRELIPKGKYDRVRIFEKGSSKIKILYNMPSSDFWGLPIFIEIINPTQEIIHLFNSFFSRHFISPKISQLEIAFDFVTDDRVKLRDALDKHLFLRYQKHSCFSFQTTFYSSDCRKTPKGTRTYCKRVDDQNVIRLELVLNRRLIRQLGLDISRMLIGDIDFKKFFSFKVINLDKIANYLIGLNKLEIEELDKLDGISGELLKRQIESWVRSRYIPRNPLKEKFMKHVERLKDKERGIPNYNRFLKDHKVLNRKFREALVDKTFIPIQKTN